MEKFYLLFISAVSPAPTKKKKPLNFYFLKRSPIGKCQEMTKICLIQTVYMEEKSPLFKDWSFLQKRKTGKTDRLFIFLPRADWVTLRRPLQSFPPADA